MAHVTLPDGREFDIEDGNAALERYYVGEGCTVGPTPDLTIPPAPSALKADWVAHAQALGDVDAEAKTKDQLVAEHGDS